MKKGAFLPEVRQRLRPIVKSFMDYEVWYQRAIRRGPNNYDAAVRAGLSKHRDGREADSCPCLQSGISRSHKHLRNALSSGNEAIRCVGVQGCTRQAHPPSPNKATLDRMVPHAQSDRTQLLREMMMEDAAPAASSGGSSAQTAITIESSESESEDGSEENDLECSASSSGERRCWTGPSCPGIASILRCGPRIQLGRNSKP